jgi:acyl-CoA synthetase (AMP-forming)/AMP-acid ligase II
MRAGFIPFPISPRNSAIAVAHLINVTKSRYVLVSSDTAMQGLYTSARERIESTEVQVFDMPTFEQLYGTECEPLPPLKDKKIDDSAIILHSSGNVFLTLCSCAMLNQHIDVLGSTAFPKPITLTFRMMLQAGLAPCI